MCSTNHVEIYQRSVHHMNQLSSWMSGLAHLRHRVRQIRLEYNVYYVCRISVTVTYRVVCIWEGQDHRTRLHIMQRGVTGMG